ncbi:MAG: SDR family oxidoreductase [Alphaproteobacteria bacterium]|jgi:NADP-dependent 3-hydroxy acid dehydrogenase YdfG|nr:SDR family oxidoreductase [Alphaproteobacteria bacterium]
MSLDDYHVAVVTGGSRGVGADVVRALRRRGLEVHAIARDADKLDALAAETGCHGHAIDVSERSSLVAAIGGLEVDVLVNNAAMTAAGTAHETTAETWARLLAVNVAGVANCLGLAVPGMMARDRGHIVNLTSLAGVHPLPGMPPYGATKAALHGLSETMRLDLYGTRVRMTEVCPGRIETGLHLDLMEDREAAQELFYGGYECLQPADVADTILFALDAPAHVDLTMIEIMPTLQVKGGVLFHKN